MDSRVNNIMGMIDILKTKETVARYRKSVENILPGGSEKNKLRYWTMYARMADSFIANPKITDKRGVIEVMFVCAKLNLNPDPVFGEIFFIPYSGKLTYQIGYKGMVKLTLNSGLIKDVRTGRVFENDFFEYWEDETGQHYKHIIDYKMSIAERGREILCYSVFDRGNGSTSFHPMESELIDNIKKTVLARTPKSPWANPDFEPEMRKKTPLRRHWKTQPKSEEIAYAIEADEAQERGEQKTQHHPEMSGIIDEILNEDELEIVEENPIDTAFGKQ